MLGKSYNMTRGLDATLLLSLRAAAGAPISGAAMIFNWLLKAQRL